MPARSVGLGMRRMLSSWSTALATEAKTGSVNIAIEFLLSSRAWTRSRKASSATLESPARARHGPRQESARRGSRRRREDTSRGAGRCTRAGGEESPGGAGTAGTGLVEKVGIMQRPGTSHLLHRGLDRTGHSQRLRQRPRVQRRHPCPSPFFRRINGDGGRGRWRLRRFRKNWRRWSRWNLSGESGEEMAVVRCKCLLAWLARRQLLCLGHFAHRKSPLV